MTVRGNWKKILPGRGGKAISIDLMDCRQHEEGHAMRRWNTAKCRGTLMTPELAIALFVIAVSVIVPVVRFLLSKSP